MFYPFPALLNPVQYGADENSALLNLPLHLRVRIWKTLHGSASKALRLTCQTVKSDIENVVGLNVTLCGPKLFNQMSILDYPTRFSPEHHLYQKIAWIRTRYITGLNLKRILRLEPHLQDLRRLPTIATLKNLTLDLDFGDPLEMATAALNYSTELEKLKITCISPLSTFKVSLTHYRDYTETTGQHILQMLRAPNRPNLKELTLEFNLEQRWKRHIFPISFHGIPMGPHLEIQFPLRLQVLKLRFPILLDTLTLEAWKTFLESQQTLRDLDLNFGFVFWRFFIELTTRNARTLRKLSLHLSNYSSQRTDDNWNIEIPSGNGWNQLDWSALISPLSDLRELKISMSEMHRIYLDQPKPTLNFQTLRLNHLQAFELNFVKLNQLELKQIFYEFPSLTRVKLGYWNRIDDSQNYALKAYAVFDLMGNVLPTNRFEWIDLEDPCLSESTAEFRETINRISGYSSLFWVKNLLFLIAQRLKMDLGPCPYFRTRRN